MLGFDNERLAALKDLEVNIGYRFTNVQCLAQALIHPSFAHETDEGFIENYQKLEFLGDAVLELTVSHLLFNQFPRANEGELSRLRSATVNESALADIARQFDLGRFLFLGKGEEHTLGRNKDSILADACEAVFGAIYLDGGFDTVFKLVERIFMPIVVDAEKGENFIDYKTLFQEYVQKNFKVVPRYHLAGAYGPAHDRLFEIHILVRDSVYGIGFGRNKKIAEQEAAREAFEAVTNGF